MSLPSGDVNTDKVGVRRNDNEGEEDAFCQRLLLLGAKWWDNEKRCQFDDGLGAGVQSFEKDVEEERVAEPTLRERGWIRIGWEGIAAYSNSNRSKLDIRGTLAFWLLDYGTSWIGKIEKHNMVPADAARVKLAASIEERWNVLRRRERCSVVTWINLRARVRS